MDMALVVDDNRAMADSLCQLLSVLDVEARPAYGSRQGLLALQEVTPKLILLDISMPGMGGLDVLAYVKREPRLAEVPVIIVSSDDQIETMARARELGAVHYLLKPASVESLESALKLAGLRH